MAVADLSPKYVIAVGVAFGVDRKKQGIGDILVSEQVLPYELQRVGADRIVLRGDRPHASPVLTKRMKSAHVLWRTEADRPAVWFGLLLSGEKLIDNPKFKQELIDLAGAPPIGGEMEGAGLYVATQNATAHDVVDHMVHWVIVKAVCDWGEQKATNKQARQKLAADNAARFVHYAIMKLASLGQSRATEASVSLSADDQILDELSAMPQDTSLILNTDYLMQESPESKNLLISMFNKIEIAKLRGQSLKIEVESPRQLELSARVKRIAAGQEEDDLGRSELELAREVEKMNRLAAVVNTIAVGASIGSWVSGAEGKAELMRLFMRNSISPYSYPPDTRPFDMVLKPKHDLSFVFHVPNSVVNEIVAREGFSGVDGYRMITSIWGFDIFDLPLGLILSEVLPRLLRFVYFSHSESGVDDYSSDHLLDLRNYTFGLH